MIGIEKLMADLAKRRPVFHSEADFQHEIAMELRSAKPDHGVRLEFPFRIEDDNRRTSLDVLVRAPDGLFGLELKYMSRAADITVDEEQFVLREQSARDVRRYDICKDVSRIEKFSARYQASGGVLVLTNDEGYWSDRRRAGTFDAAFDLGEARILGGTLDWAPGTSDGTKKDRTNPLTITGRYQLGWRDYANLSGRGGRFRYLYIPVSSTS